MSLVAIIATFIGLFVIGGSYHSIPKQGFWIFFGRFQIAFLWEHNHHAILAGIQGDIRPKFILSGFLLLIAFLAEWRQIVLHRRDPLRPSRPFLYVACFFSALASYSSFYAGLCP